MIRKCKPTQTVVYELILPICFGTCTHETNTFFTRSAPGKANYKSRIEVPFCEIRMHPLVRTCNFWRRKQIFWGQKVPKNPKYALNMRKYAEICAISENFKICAKYAEICGNMQSTYSPPLLKNATHVRSWRTISREVCIVLGRNCSCSGSSP